MSRLQMALKKQIAYARKVLPSATWRALKSSARGPVHLILALADHFEPAIDLDDHLVRGKTMTGRIWRLLMFELWHRNFLEKYIKPAGLFSLPVVADSRRQAPNSATALASAPVGG